MKITHIFLLPYTLFNILTATQCWILVVEGDAKENHSLYIKTRLRIADVQNDETRIVCGRFDSVGDLIGR